MPDPTRQTLMTDAEQQMQVAVETAAYEARTVLAFLSLLSGAPTHRPFFRQPEVISDLHEARIALDEILKGVRFDA